MVTKDIASITGYIPELMYKMTPAEMNDYVIQGTQDPDCFEDTDIIPKDYETTQAELTPMSSGRLSSLKISDTERDEAADCDEDMDKQLSTIDGNQAMEEYFEDDDESTELVSDASEETVTASMSADEIVVLQPMQETAHPLEKKLHSLHQYQHHSSSLSSSSGSNSPSNKLILSVGPIGMLNEKLQQLKRNQQQSPAVREHSTSSCSLQQTRSQKKTDSESSDGERVCIEQLA